MPKITAALPRAIQLGLFRIHLDNGLSVAAGLALTGCLFGWALGVPAAVAAATGALCVSVMDQPDPLHRKPWILASAIVPAALATLAAVLSKGLPWVLLPATLLLGLWTGLISVYGKRAIGLGMATTLAFVFGLGARSATLRDALLHEALFVGGALTYALYAEFAAVFLEGRLRRLLLAETLRALAQYLRAKAALYDMDIPAARGFAVLIEAQADLAERLQTARDGLYPRSRSPTHFRQIEILIAMLDAFEVSLSGDADVEALRLSSHRNLNLSIRRAILAMADEVEAMIPTVGGWRPRRRAAESAEHRHLADDIARLTKAAAPRTAQDDLAGFRSTVVKLGHADAALARLRTALDPNAPLTGVGANLDLTPFAQRSGIGLAILRQQLTLNAPAMRYAIRLCCALGAGMALTLAFPGLIHGGWVLLTTALIMRANYGVTRRRRRDRLIGTVAGCVAAVGLINFAPPVLLFAAIVVAMGVSHAYAAINYRITALCASITALVLLHVMAPGSHPLFLERLLDTLAGAALSYGFSFLLPSWTRDALPGALASLLSANAAFAAQALARDPSDQAYRLARKQTLDAGLALARLVRDLAGEPGAESGSMEKLNALLGANYLLVSDLASVQVLLRTRAGQLPAAADPWIMDARAVVTAALVGPAALGRPRTALSRRSIGRLQTDDALTTLARRLAHIERGAQTLARLAAAAQASRGT